jgi:hypothetical protein
VSGLVGGGDSDAVCEPALGQVVERPSGDPFREPHELRVVPSPSRRWIAHSRRTRTKGWSQTLRRSACTVIAPHVGRLVEQMVTPGVTDLQPPQRGFRGSRVQGVERLLRREPELALGPEPLGIVASPSFSHTSCLVSRATESPYHWCANSWTTTSSPRVGLRGRARTLPVHETGLVHERKADGGLVHDPAGGLVRVPPEPLRLRLEDLALPPQEDSILSRNGAPMPESTASITGRSEGVVHRWTSSRPTAMNAR